jgi:dTDP-4-dehydrorhamnose 3,5-epimerase
MQPNANSTLNVYQTPATPSAVIDGVFIMPLKTYADERGRFTETFRREWFPWINWERLQSNRSDSKGGVLRGLHYHHKQVDYWYVPSGRVRAAMVDLRAWSPTYMATQTIALGEDHNMGLFIPIGVAHGFLALTDATLTYLVNNYYDNSDECGVAWDDPQIKLDWGHSAPPLLSPRDQANRRLADIPTNELPQR